MDKVMQICKLMKYLLKRWSLFLTLYNEDAFLNVCYMQAIKACIKEITRQ